MIRWWRDGARLVKVRHPGVSGMQPMPSLRGLRGEQGYATVEFALTLPAILLVLGFGIALLAGAGTDLRANDAARAAAREVAVGAGESGAAAVVASLAGPEAELRLSTHGDLVIAEVLVPLPLLGEWGEFNAHGRAAARREESVLGEEAVLAEESVLGSG